MRKKSILIVIFFLLLIYPIFSLFGLENTLSSSGTILSEVQADLRAYQASIWISWVVMVILAVYHKWTTGKNFMFHLVYGFVIVAFVLFGYYTQRTVSVFEVPSSFEDDHTLGIFAAVQNIVVSGILTGFLQAGAWWFTRRWHRR